jgi:predicted GNAT family acetyltransferase
MTEATLPELAVIDNAPMRRFEVRADGELAAFSMYRIEDDGGYAFTHTQTLAGFTGQGIASALIEQVLQQLRAAGRRVRPYCPFVNRYLRAHAEFADLVPIAERKRFGITGETLPSEGAPSAITPSAQPESSA